MVIVTRTIWGNRLTNKECTCGSQQWFALNKKRDEFGRCIEYRYKCVVCGKKETEPSSIVS